MAMHGPLQRGPTQGYCIFLLAESAGCLADSTHGMIIRRDVARRSEALFRIDLLRGYAVDLPLAEAPDTEELSCSPISLESLAPLKVDKMFTYLLTL